MRAGSSRRWRVGLAAVAVKLVLLALLAWWWQGRGGGAAPALTAEVTSGARSGATPPVVMHAAASAPALAARPNAGLPAAATQPATSAPAGPSAPITLELCGVGEVTVKPPPPGQTPSPDAALPHLFQHANEDAWPQVLANLDKSPAERGRAAGLVLRAAGMPGVSGHDNDTLVRQLALMAARSPDPGIYQWAWSLCHRARGTPECQALSPQGWVDRAPDDVRGWLLLAEADPAAREQALQRAAQARAVVALPSLTPWVDGAMPPNLPPYLRVGLLMETMGVEAAFADTAYFFALDHCAKRPEARATCSALADNLARHGSDSMSLGMARIIGRRVGWPPERVAAVENIDTALLRQLVPDDPAQIYTCASVERYAAWFRDRAAMGERAALQQRAAAKKLSVPNAPGGASR